MELITKTNTGQPKETAKTDFFKEVLSKRIKATDNIKANEYLLRIENTNKFSKGNISGWIGRAKSKKTFALTMFGAALASGQSIYGKFNANKPVGVLWIDTEQSPADVQRVVKRVQKMIHSEERLLMYGLRPLSPKQRIEAIEILLNQHKNEVEVLVVDGVRDLLMDINNAVESTEVMTLLMKWSYDYDIHIATVLHQNKGDGNSRGHIGSELENKAETIIRITKDETDNSVSNIEEVYGRGKGFKKFDFSIDDNGLPYVVNNLLDDIDLDKAPWEV